MFNTAHAYIQVHLKSPDEYRANGTITNLMHEFLASSLGRYREFIKSPSQGPPRTPVAHASTPGPHSPSTGANDFESGGSLTPGSSQTAPTTGYGEGVPLTPGSRSESGAGSDSAFEEETIIRGNNGFRFYHSAFANSFASKANREFAGALIHTQMWQVLALSYDSYHAC